MVTKLLTTINDREILDGQIDTFVDQGGGADRYLIESTISGDVEVQDADGGVVVIPAGVNLESIRIAAGGTAVQLVVNGSTITFTSGAAGANYSFVLAGSNENLAAGRPLTAQELAAEVGATLGGDAVPGGIVGSDGTIGGGIDPGAIVLTEGVDIETGNLFEAPRGFTPGGTDQVNTLDDDDVLTGTGDNPTLNFTFVDDADIGPVVISPTLNNIQTVNVSVQGNAPKNLDLQDATGLDSLNVSRINASNLFQAVNLAEPVSNFSINNSVNPTGTANFAHLTGVLSGAMDETTLTLNGAQMLSVNIDNTLFNALGAVASAPTEGYETVNIVSTGNANSIGGIGNINGGTLGIFGAQTINISGDQDLRLGGIGNAVGALSGNLEANNFQAGLNGVNGFLTTVDASGLAGDLTYHVGGEPFGPSSAGSGAPINFTATGGAGDDTFVLTGTLVNGITGDTDIFDGGAGDNTLVVVGNSQVVAAATPNIRNIQNLEVRTGHDIEFPGGPTADVVVVNAAAFDSLANIFVRNEGQDLIAVGGAITSVLENATVTLNNLTAAQATGITVAHGTTANNALSSTLLNASLANAAGAADTVGVTLVNALNTDTRFNLQLNAPGGPGVANATENVTLTDNDTESNSILLNTFGEHTGTITLSGGRAGQFMNLDALDAGGGVITPVGIYGLDVSGSTTVAPPADVVAVNADTDVAAALAVANRVDSASPVAGLLVRDGLVTDVRLVANGIAASDYVGNVVVRLGENVAPIDVTVNTGSGNDTIVFDAVALGANVPVQLDSAGLSSADRVNTGMGFDTVVIDGQNANGIVLDPTEFSQFSGVDALRFGFNAGTVNVGNNTVVAANAGGYRVAISNELIQQTDAGNRLLIINNEGDLSTEVESDLVLNLRDLSGDQLDPTNSRLVTFVGANGDGFGQVSSNRVQLSESSATNGMILDGGDTNFNEGGIGFNGVAGVSTGNNNLYEVFGNANLTINDLANTSNFGQVHFTNANAPLTTSTISLDNATADRLVDTSNAANAATNRENLALVANNSFNPVTGVVAGVQQLNVNAGNLSSAFNLQVVLGGGQNNVTTGAGNDVISLTGNYTAAQGAGKPNIAVGQSGAIIAPATRATGIDEFGVDGIAATADDAAAQLVYTGTITGGTVPGVVGEVDVVNIYGAANVTGVTFVGIEAINVFSNVSLTEAQLNTIPVSVQGAGNHVLFLVDDINVAGGNANLNNITVADGAVVTVVQGAGVTAINAPVLGVGSVLQVVDANFNQLQVFGGQVIIGTPGDDTLVGTFGNDTIDGLAGMDTIDGGEGDDIIDGGADADMLTGGAGADVFLLNDFATVDTLVDFATAEDQVGIGGNASNMLLIASIGGTIDTRTVSTAGTFNAGVQFTDGLLFKAADVAALQTAITMAMKGNADLDGVVAFGFTTGTGGMLYRFVLSDNDTANASAGTMFSTTTALAVIGTGAIVGSDLVLF